MYKSCKKLPKSRDLFVVKNNLIYLNHCGVSPLPRCALIEQEHFNEAQAKGGILVFDTFPDILRQFHLSAAKLLKTDKNNVSFIPNTAFGLNLIADGYPLEHGDEIISYCCEYPSNHYPWLLQHRYQRAKLILLNNYDLFTKTTISLPNAWSLEELQTLITARTRIIALSHVQFTSGFAAELKSLSKICRDKNIDLIIDAAQSLGAVPLYPDQLGITALAASGWKWLLGPIGCGILYTSPALRAKLQLRMVGPDHMHQGDNYLDYTWNPFTDGRLFEYSTNAYSLAAGLNANLEEIFLPNSLELIQEEIFRLQDLAISLLTRDKISPLVFPEPHRSPILSLRTKTDPHLLCKELRKLNIILSSRGGYLRFAPHFYNDDEEIEKAVTALNNLS